MSRMGRRQRGMTLVELMVSMTIGLAVTLAAGSLLLSANAAYATQEDAAAMADGGRYALEVIGRAVRQAAYANWEQVDIAAGLDTAGPNRVEGLDASSVSKTSNGIADPLPAAVNGSDVLALRFAGAGPAPGGDGSMTDCAGFPVHGQEEGWSIFYVARGSDGEYELRCKYRGAAGWGADAIVAGVDSFQVLYGLDTDGEPDGVANQYMNASAVRTLDAALVLAGADAAQRELDRLRRTHWKRVVSIKVALVLHGLGPRRGGRESAVYDAFGAAYGDRFGASDAGSRLREDGLPAALRTRERKLFGATIVLRNRS
jgi:type IV pilus assembly protein PilW